MPEPTDTAKAAKEWLKEIDRARKKEEKWRERGRKIIKAFRSDDKDKQDQYNILASNTLTLQAALYPKTPSPVARQRGSIDDKPAREASNILEKALAFSIDEYDFDHAMKSVLLDGLLPGRGNARVRYIPTMVDVPAQVPVAQMKDDKAAEDVAMNPETGVIEATVTQQEVGYEEVRCEYQDWRDVVYIGGTRWEKIAAVAFKGEYTREELVEQFGEEIGSAVRLTLKDDDKQPEKSGEPEPERALVWEIWDKKAKSRLYISEGYDDGILKEEPDPLQLKGFFPIPRPMGFVGSNDTMTPVPLFELYRKQAEELNDVTARIQRLIAKLQAKGIYNAVVKEVAQIYAEDDNTYIPAIIPPDVNLNNMVVHWPIEQIARVLTELQNQREHIKQVIYEVTGISDIIRGASNASETATAQRIKGQYASIRLDDLSAEVKRFVRDLMDLKAEVMAIHFAPETLTAIAGVSYPTQAEKMQAQMQMQAQQQADMQMAAVAQAQGVMPMPPAPPDPAMLDMLNKPSMEEVMGVLKQSMPRRYRIDVETEDTLEPDVDADRQRAIELVQGVAQLAPAVPAIDMAFGPGFAKELMAVTIRKFHTGKQIDDILDKALALPVMPMMPPQAAPPEQEKAA